MNTANIPFAYLVLALYQVGKGSY